MTDDAGFVVVDIWKAKSGKQEELHTVLADAGRRFRKMDGILSVDYTRLVDDEERYIVVFRYRDRAARDAFVETDALRSTMERLRSLWDLESPICQGASTGL